jgi:hypothetical protein
VGAIYNKIPVFLKTALAFFCITPSIRLQPLPRNGYSQHGCRMTTLFLSG